MKFQKGVSLSGLLVWCFILAFGALLGMKVIPAYVEFGKTQSAIKKVAAQAGQYPSPDALRVAYAKFAEIDQLDLKPSELRFVPQGARTDIEFSYDKVIPLVANISLVISFNGSSK